MNIIEKIVTAVAIPMTAPKAYGTFHILLMIFGLTIAIGLAWLFRQFDDKKNKILLLTVSGVLIASEIFKQFFCTYVLFDGVYHFHELPFHMCSVPMYICPIAVFCKNERVRRAIYGFLMSFNLIGGLGAVFEPSGTFHSWVFLTAHSITWHYLLVFLGFYIIFSHRMGKTKADFFDTFKLFCILAYIAFCINTLVDITTGDLIHMFFVGPNPSTLIVFNTIAEKFGWVASTVVYVPLLTLTAALLFTLGQIGRPKAVAAEAKNESLKTTFAALDH